MQERADKCCQIAHRHGHVNATECLVNALVVRALDKIAWLQLSNLLATADGDLELVLLSHQAQQWWSQIETNSDFDDGAYCERNDLNVCREFPVASDHLDEQNQRENAEHRVHGEVLGEEDLLTEAKRVSWQCKV